MVDAHYPNLGKRNTAGQRPWAVGLWNDFAESLGNIENLEQLKAEVKKLWKSHFLISFFFSINFTYCKVNNYAFNYQIAIVKLAEKPFYGVGW